MAQKIILFLVIIILGLVAARLVVVTLSPTGSKSASSQNRLAKMDDTRKAYPEASQAPRLANPASQNCIKQGGTVSIMTRGDGGEFGLCNFEDNMSCEEWALLRGECPVGGVKTTGFDTQAQMYCAWLGGQTLAVPNATCTLPGGSTCSTNDLYDGTCG